jgi:hypothetical protein
MKELKESTCGFVLEGSDPKYDSQICSAELEQQGQPAGKANAGDYEFVADSGEFWLGCDTGAFPHLAAGC